MKNLFEEAADRSFRYLNTLKDRNVFPSTEAIKKLRQFDESLPEKTTDPHKILELLD